MYSNVPFQWETYNTGFQEMGKDSQRKQKRGDILSQLPSSEMDKHEPNSNFLCESDWAIQFGQAYDKNHFIFNMILFYTPYRSALSSFAPWDLFEARMLFI